MYTAYTHLVAALQQSLNNSGAGTNLHRTTFGLLLCWQTASHHKKNLHETKSFSFNCGDHSNDIWFSAAH